MASCEEKILSEKKEYRQNEEDYRGDDLELVRARFIPCKAFGHEPSSKLWRRLPIQIASSSVIVFLKFNSHI